MSRRRRPRSASPRSRSGSASRRRRPATCTSATSAAPCSTGCSPGTTAAPSCCGSRTPTPAATWPSPTQGVLDSLTWLGLDWDEGPEVGRTVRPVRPVRARRDLPRRSSRQLLEAGLAYRCYCTREEIEAREAARPEGAPSGYDGFCRNLSAERIAELEAVGPRRWSGCGCPDASDRLRRPGPRSGHVRRRARPGLRDRPRQRGAALHPGQPGRRRADGDHPRAPRGGPAALDAPADRALPGARSRSASAADGRRSSATCRPCSARATGGCPSGTRDRDWPSTSEQGYLPEALLNYLALLGWAIADDRDVFTLDEMVRGLRHPPGQRQPGAVRPEEVRGDQRRAHPAAAHRGAGRPAGAVPGGRPDWSAIRRCPTSGPGWTAATPLVQERMNTLSEVSALLGFLFVDDDRLVIEDSAGLAPTPSPCWPPPRRPWARWRPSTRPRSRRRCAAALIDGLGLKPKLAFGPVRAAITGRRISPPLFESLELLGRDSALARIAAARRRLGRLRWPTEVHARLDPASRAARASADAAGPSRPARPSSAAARPRAADRRAGRAAAGRRDVPADPARSELRLVALGARRGLRAVAVPAADHGDQPGRDRLTWSLHRRTGALPGLLRRRRSASSARSACWPPTSASPP